MQLRGLDHRKQVERRALQHRDARRILDFLIPTVHPVARKKERKKGSELPSAFLRGQEHTACYSHVLAEEGRNLTRAKHAAAPLADERLLRRTKQLTERANNCIARQGEEWRVQNFSFCSTKKLQIRAKRKNKRPTTTHLFRGERRSDPPSTFVARHTRQME